MNADPKIKANELLRHYKSILNFSNLVAEATGEVLVTARILAVDHCIQTLNNMQSLINKVTENKDYDVVPAGFTINSEYKFWKKVKQFLETHE